MDPVSGIVAMVAMLALAYVGAKIVASVESYYQAKLDLEEEANYRRWLEEQEDEDDDGGC